jgi:shikimate dehydrogenase
VTEYRLAVVGDPIEHSRSPAIHRVLLDLAGLEGEYLAVRGDTPVLRSLVEELRQGRWDGLNVTMPLKGEAAALADRLSLDAERAQSVNTLLLRDGSVAGETTDCATFRFLLGDERMKNDGSILVLGAGGSAAAALAALPPDGAVYVSSRNAERSRTLSNRLGGQMLPWGSVVAGALIINATPLGMRAESLPAGLLDVASGLIDLPYGSHPSPAVTSAREMGLPFVDGFEFLIRQAMASFELWTGVGVAYEPVAAALRKV